MDQSLSLTKNEADVSSLSLNALKNCHFRWEEFKERPETKILFLKQYQEFGFVILEQAVCPADIQKLCLAADHFSETRADGEHRYAPYHHIDRIEPDFSRIVRSPILIEVTGMLAGGKVDSVQSLFYFKPPGYLGFSRHQDNYFVQSDPADSFVIAWLAIDSADEENGGLAVYPGTHKLPILPVSQREGMPGSTQSKTVHEQYGDISVPSPFERNFVEIPSGCLILMHANLVHESGDNRSADRFRRALSLDYIAWGAKFRPGNSSKRVRTNIYS